MSTYESAKALLEKEGTTSGANVFDHLSGVILKILNESPDDPVASFEALSLAVKKTSYTQASNEGAQLGLSDEAKAAQLAAANNTLAKLAVGEDGPTEGAEVQDLLGENSLLEWAGVNLGQAEAYQLSCFMKTLVAKEAAPEDESDPVTINKIRFWGKILGAKGVDYYIYECQCDDRSIEVSNRKDVHFLLWLWLLLWLCCSIGHQRTLARRVGCLESLGWPQPCVLWFPVPLDTHACAHNDSPHFLFPVLRFPKAYAWKVRTVSIV